MPKISALVLAGLVLAASSYQMLATDSFADADRTTARHELEIVTRNAAIGAFTQAKHLVEDARSIDDFAGEGRVIGGTYQEAAYRAYIVSNGHSVLIRSTARAMNAADTVDFAVTAEVAWESYPSESPSSGRYLVLKAYHEQ